MATYKHAALIRQSIDSVLAQTFSDFELIVVNDASPDDTAAVLSSYTDPRIRAVHHQQNLGIVATRNRAWREARGEYVANLDSDDVCLPTRIAQQVKHLDQNPRTVLLGTALYVLNGSDLRANDIDPTGMTPNVVRWVLHMTNPIGHSSIMFRAAAVRQLGTYLREEFTYCEDYDFYARMMRVGDIAMLPERLAICRVHGGRASTGNPEKFETNILQVLLGLHRELLGTQSADAELLGRYLGHGRAVEDLQTLHRLGRYLDRLLAAFANANPMSEAERERVGIWAGHLWWRTVRATLREGRIHSLRPYWTGSATGRLHKFPLLDGLESLLIGLMRRHLARPAKPSAKCGPTDVVNTLPPASVATEHENL